jgi:sigma-B regulation protein RsbU (phosphoserine phosphatase)
LRSDDLTTSTAPSDIPRQQLRALTEVGRALTRAFSLDEVFELVVERAARLLEADRAVLLLADCDGLLSVRARKGLDGPTCEQFREPLRETLIVRLKELLDADGERGFLGVPLVVRDEVKGLLAVSRIASATEDEEAEWLLSALADHAAVALEKSLLDETATFRERLIGIVSHDLRNPISAISLAAQTLARLPDTSEQVQGVADRIQASAWRAGRMIDDLLDYTQSRLGGGIRIETRPADLKSVFEQVADEISLAHPGRELVASQKGDLRGEWDPDRLAQVMGNLLSNAMDYSPLETPVRLRAWASDDRVFVSVTNEGESIPADRLPDLFEPMQRATSEVQPGRRSVGLGLYIVKQIVEAHGGTVDVETSTEAGTTFTVCLPRRAGQRAHLSH